MKKKQGDVVKKRKKIQIVPKTVARVLLAVLLVAALSIMQSVRLEDGLIDVCAAQQDAYVQLILDQINLKENRDNQDIVENILQTMDASSNKYWVFSSEQTMLFVKDVLETNKYKGFTAETYFLTDSAKHFFENLRTNKVVHGVIKIEENSYIASGVLFEYQGEEYRLCLLTNTMVLLENNELLRARTEIGVTIFFLTVLFALTALLFAMKVRKLELEKADTHKTMQEMNEHIERLNDQLTKWDIHDTQKNVWSRDSLLGFAERLEQRAAYPLTLVLVRTGDLAESKKFLDLAHYVLDHNQLRFQINDMLFAFLFVQCDARAVDYSLKPLVARYGQVIRSITVDENSEEDLVSCCKRVLEGEYTDADISRIPD